MDAVPLVRPYPSYVSPPPPHPVNHVTGLVNSANDLRCYALRRPCNLSRSYSILSCFVPLLSADYALSRNRYMRGERERKEENTLRLVELIIDVEIIRRQPRLRSIIVVKRE